MDRAKEAASFFLLSMRQRAKRENSLVLYLKGKNKGGSQQRNDEDTVQSREKEERKME